MLKHHSLRCLTTCAFMGLAICSWVASVAAAETSSPATEAQIAAWVKQLGDEDFQKRIDAKKALLQAGKAAIPALKSAAESADPEVKNAAGVLLDQLKWQMIRANPHYLELFPDESIFVLHLSHLEETIASGRKTGLGMILDGPEFKPLTEWIVKQMEAAPNETGLVLKWAKRIKGQVAGAVWDLNPMDPSKMRMAAIIELPAEDTEKAFQELLAETHLNEILQESQQQGLSIWQGRDGNGAIALAGRHLVFGANLASILQVANGLCQPLEKNLTANPGYRKIKASQKGAADFSLFINFIAYQKMLAGLPGVGAIAGLFGDMGLVNMEWLAMLTSVVGDRFEERIVMTMNDKPSKMTKYINAMQAEQKPVGAELAAAPADAVMVSDSGLDGSTMLDFGLDYFKALFQMQAAMGAQGMDLKEEVEKIEQRLGMKLADLAACLKGNSVFWARLSKELQPPDLGLSIACPDEAKAKDLSEKLVLLVNLLSKQNTGIESPAMEKVTKDGHTFYTESEDSPMLAKPKRKAIPYRLSWAAQGSRVHVSTSAQLLQERLTALAAKSPGFDAAKALPPGVPAAEVTGLSVVDLRMLLNYAVKFGLPVLSMQLAKQPEVQRIVLDLAKKEDLFKSMSPMVAINGQVKDGVLVSTIYTPLPIIPSYIGLIAVIVLLKG